MGWGARGAAVVVAGGVLSGCGGASPLPQTSPGPSATASASATPTSTSTPTASAEPSEVPSPDPTAAPPERSAVGAQAFARYYVLVVDQAFATGRTGTLARLSAKDCKTCANWLANIEQVYGAGGRIHGGQVRVDGSSATAPTDTASVEVTALVTQETDLDAKGKVINTYPEAKGLLVFTLGWLDGNWQVREVRLGGLQ
jgi:hypothetical protein